MTKALVNKVQELQATVSFLNSKRSLLEGELERLRALVGIKTKDVESALLQLANQTRAANNLKAVLDNKDIDIRELELKLNNAAQDLRREQEQQTKTRHHYEDRNSDLYISYKKEEETKHLFQFFTFIETLSLAIIALCWCFDHVRFV